MRKLCAKLGGMTAKDLLLEQAPSWSDAQATAALRVVAAQTELATYLADEASCSAEELDERENGWAEANAHEAILEEPW
jgi:hypothetical protein